MSRILITGGAGFIGSSLAREFAGRGHEVTILDTLSPQVHGTDPSASPLVQAARSAGRLLVGDVTSRADIAGALADQEIVVHLAAETGTGQSMYEIERYTRVNVGGTAQLLDVLANDPNRTVSKIVVASSRSIYGEGAYRSAELGVVYPEARKEADLACGRFNPTYPGDVSGLEVVPTVEDSRIHPTSVYGITKHTQEALVMTVGPAIGIAPVALRYQNVYGPGQSLTNPYTGILSIFSALIRRGKPINVFEDGLESRDFVFIDDAIRATAVAAVEPRAHNQVINVGSGVPTTVSAVVAELIRAFRREVPVRVTGNFRLGDIRHNVADISLAGDILGFAPSVSFRAGVAAFAAWADRQTLPEDRYASSLDEMRQRRLLR